MTEDKKTLKDLSEKDKKEIINLFVFKKIVKEKSKLPQHQ